MDNDERLIAEDVDTVILTMLRLRWAKMANKYKYFLQYTIDTYLYCEKKQKHSRIILYYFLTDDAFLTVSMLHVTCSVYGTLKAYHDLLCTICN